MKLLIKQAFISDKNSRFNGQTKDVLITDGVITSLEDDILVEVDNTIAFENLIISPGWIDSFSHFNDPGFEYKETLETGAYAAAAGGFTTVLVLPNTSPVISNKGQVEYIVQKSKTLPVNILPLGAITKNAEGKELAEMYDMHNSGAAAFTDGIHPIQTPGVLLKALQYIKAFNGVIVQLPIDESIAQHGLINESITSTQLGLPGLPAIAEELIISRDIELAKYTGSRIHFSGITTAKSVELITAAKQNGINVTCSVTPYNLFFTDEDLSTYDTNLKVNPPLRSKADVAALRQAVLDGKIDCIATHHLPQDWDNKTCEFEYARHGMIGLETCFRVFNSLFPTINLQSINDMFCNNAQQIFNLPSSKIDAGCKANITMFERESMSTFIKENIKSKSCNTPFLNKQLKGSVIGVINKDTLYLNDKN